METIEELSKRILEGNLSQLQKYDMRIVADLLCSLCEADKKEPNLKNLFLYAAALNTELEKEQLRFGRQ